MTKRFLFLLLLSGAAAAHAAVLTVAEARAHAARGETVETEGVITCQADDKFVLEDETGGLTANYGQLSWHVGDRVRVRGRLYVEREDGPFNFLALSIQTVKRLDAPPPPPVVSPREVRQNPQLAYRRVRVCGTVTSVFRDEIDPEWTFLFLEADGERIITAIWTAASGCDIPENLVDAEVSLCGIVQISGGNSRRHIGTYVSCFSDPDIRVTRPAPTDPFIGTPSLSLALNDIAAAARSGHRHRLNGTVVVAWDGQLFLRTDDNQRLRISLAPSQPLPTAGKRIVASGFVRRSLFFTHLTNALWKPTKTTAAATDSVTNVTVRALLADNNNTPRIQAEFHGRLIRLEGTMRNIYHPTATTTTITLLDGDRTVDVLADFLAEIPLNARLRVTGACLFNEQLPVDGTPFTRLTGFSVIPRAPDDLVVTEQPAWWTSARLFAVIGFLALVIVAILIWNAVLQKLVNRRSRQLLRETLARKDADLRTSERMRLAVELHDSIAQNLTGVSLQLDAVEQAYEAASPATGRIIAATKRMLESCCGELRDCLWDLRSSSLDRRDTSAALRQAIAPHLNGTDATVDVKISRHKLSDSLFHALLSIVRELTVNAVRHGQARHIRIEGGLSGDKITLSVSDDGIGFDPAQVPGVSEGHFGLQGIRERLEALGGKLEIHSSPGHGASFSLSIET